MISAHKILILILLGGLLILGTSCSEKDYSEDRICEGVLVHAEFSQAGYRDTVWILYIDVEGILNLFVVKHYPNRIYEIGQRYSIYRIGNRYEALKIVEYPFCEEEGKSR